MKKFWFVLVLSIAVPLLAQDETPSGALAGAGGAQVFTRVDAVNPMEQVKTFLAKANVNLTSDQEKALKPTVETAIKQLRDINDRFAAQRGARGGGERRGGGAAGLGALANGPAAPEVKKINDDLMTRISEVLKPDQQAAFKKFQNDEIKKAGGFGALKIVMAEAGAPLSAEQEPQIQAVYTEDTQQRTQLVRESQGQPDTAKLADLQKSTMAKVVRLLTPAQRKALLESRAKQQ